MKDQIKQLNGPHPKTCACGCKMEFLGRKNQKYINVQHKSIINNAKRSKEWDNFKPWFDEMMVSYRALSASLKDRDENNWVFLGKLTKRGFDPDIATKTAETTSGIPFKYILDIAFQLSEDKKHVQFEKIK